MLELLKTIFLPQAVNVPLKEKFYSGLASLVGVLMVMWVSQISSGDHGVVFVAASIGSAAVLLFAIPHSPMAQPWPIFGGHVISAFFGVVCFQWLGETPFSAALAVAVSIIAMYQFRCMNPPGAAAALGAIIGGPAIHELGYAYVIAPVGLNVLVILIVAIIVNNLIPGRRYPVFSDNRQPETPQNDFSWALGASHIKNVDIDEALENYKSFIDADRDELREIFHQATMNAYKRRIGHITCGELMSNEPNKVTVNMLIEPVRQLMKLRHRVALPVIDEQRHVLGMVTLDDIEQDWPAMTRVADILNKKTETAYVDQHVVDIVPIISQQGWRAIPVVDENNILQGVISRTEISRVLMSLR